MRRKTKTDMLRADFDAAMDAAIETIVNAITEPMEDLYYRAYNAGLRDGWAGVRPPRCEGRPKLYLVKG